MRLDPVFLVAPAPKPPSMTTRRAFLLAGGMFFGGLGLGGACGYAAGVRTGGSAPVDGGGGKAADQPKLPPSSGDAELDDLRRLALAAPIEELVKEWSYFLDEYSLRYRKDEYIPHGVGRLIDFVVTTRDYADRKLLAAVLKDIVNRGEESLQERFAPRIPDLMRVR